jgi:hypothetical protein
MKNDAMRFFSQKKLYNKKKNSGVTRKNEKKLQWAIRFFCLSPPPFTLKKAILRQKKNFGNSNISPCKNIIF